MEFIKNEDYKYVRLLGAFYLRLVGKPLDVYQYLEPLFNDYRRCRRRTADGGYVVQNLDSFVEELLTKDFVCDVTLPRIPHRWTLEASGLLQPRRSVLEEGIDELLEQGEVAAAGAAAAGPAAAAPPPGDEIAQANALRASLGLKPLRP